MWLSWGVSYEVESLCKSKNVQVGEEMIKSNLCPCGHHMDIKDKHGQMRINSDKKFFGGNVEAFFDATCPECQAEYELYTKRKKNEWHIVAMKPSEGVAADMFETMEKQELKDWLDARGIEYTANWGEKRLKELCREHF